MFLKSHKWTVIPSTKTEIRSMFNVRESAHTVMIWDKRYYDSDTGKFNKDKLCTLNSMGLIDLIRDDYGESYNNYPMPREFNKRSIERDKIYNFPKFVPKDDYFDEEIRIEKENKEKLDREYAIKRLEEHNRILEEKRIELDKKKQEYAKQLAETEKRLLKERNERFERIQQANQLRHAGNVRSNSWRPK